MDTQTHGTFWKGRIPKVSVGGGKNRCAVDTTQQIVTASTKNSRGEENSILHLNVSPCTPSGRKGDYIKIYNIGRVREMQRCLPKATNKGVETWHQHEGDSLPFKATPNSKWKRTTKRFHQMQRTGMRSFPFCIADNSNRSKWILAQDFSKFELQVKKWHICHHMYQVQ